MLRYDSVYIPYGPRRPPKGQEMPKHNLVCLTNKTTTQKILRLAASSPETITEFENSSLLIS